MSKIFSFVKATLNLFKAVPDLSNEKFPAYTLDNEKNLTHGFFVTEKAFKLCPAVADTSILKFIDEKYGYNILELNQGFYKSFRTVANLSPQEILANKLLHYMSTYGFERLGIFNSALVYIPNDALELPANAKPVKITVIDGIDNAEIEERLNTLVKSSAALSEETLGDLVTIVKFLGIELNVDDIPNKEFAIRLCEILNILPKDPAQFLRYMIYVTTGTTLLIKNGATAYQIRHAKEKSEIIDEFDNVCVKEEDLKKLIEEFDLKSKREKVSPFDDYFERYIARNGIEKLASAFHRFKPLWLAFKPHSDYLRRTVNKMRKLADRYHKPVTPKFLERLTSASEIDLKQLKRELGKVTTYRKISLANAILYRSAQPKDIFYNLRNDKIFVDDYSGSLKFDAQPVIEVILESIVKDIRANVQGKKIYIPERFTYAAPVSEKKFVGNIPFGSSYDFSCNSIVVGVHWFNILDKYGNELRVDLDLHLNSLHYDIGWHNDFRGENVINTKERKAIFSGDMTDAPIKSGGATEAFFVGEALTDEMIMVNLNSYNGIKNVPFKLVLADVEQESIDRQYLLDAHEIAFCVPNKIPSGQMMLGFIRSNGLGEKKFYFYSRQTGKNIVARTTETTVKMNDAMCVSAETSLSFNAILKKAGAIFEDVTAENCDINLDPAKVTRDVLIGLLAKKK